MTPALVAALLLTQSAAVRDTTLFASAYLDGGARDLVRAGRERREREERAITAYQVLVKQRISVGLRALRRDRMLYRRESAARVHWRRGATSYVQVLGAREVIPVVFAGIRIPEGLALEMTNLPFDPSASQIDIGLNEPDFLQHPLSRRSEEHYQFASGDTTEVRFADGRTIRVIELRVTPRRDEFRLVGGSFWLDEVSHAVVRATFRPARPFDVERDLEPDDTEDWSGKVPGLLKPMRAEINYVTIEYGLFQQRWWLPRLIAFDGSASAGSFMHFPVRAERTYSEYEIHAEGLAIGPAAMVRDTSWMDWTPTDTRRIGRRRQCLPRASGGGCQRIEILVPRDTLLLVESQYLPGSIYADGETMLTQGDLRDIAAQLDALPAEPWKAQAPTFAIGLGKAGLIRYNRVESLSLGGRTDVDLGKLQLDASARIGAADLTPNAEVGITRVTGTGVYRLAGFRRLVVVDPATRALGFGNSLNALLLGRDDGDYYRALGVELTANPPENGSRYGAWRIYAERHRPAQHETNISLAHLFDPTDVFRPNIDAAPADQIGAEVSLHATRGLNPTGVRWAGELSLEGSSGTYAFGRVSAVQRITTPLPARLIGGFEVAAGTTFGDVPIQRFWYLGGAASLRGYGGNAARGEAFWRGRLEIANQFPGFRIAAFSDAGWAGPRSAFALRDPLWSLGAGASFLDGVLRIDLARPMRGGGGLRLDLYVDGIL